MVGRMGSTPEERMRELENAIRRRAVGRTLKVGWTHRDAAEEFVKRGALIRIDRNLTYRVVREL